MSDPARSGPWDLAVVGGGAAGLTAARAAAAAGRRTLLVQDGPPGGDCTFTGCVPSKTLIAAAAAGIAPEAAWARVGATVAAVAREEDADALRRLGIAVLAGRARLVPGGGIDVDGRRVDAGRVVLATGSRPIMPSVPGLDGVPALTTDDLWDLPAPPSSLAVVGGGATGCELAQALARLGARVTVVESEPRLLGREDPDAAAIVAAALTRDGVEVRTATRVAGVATGAAGVELSLDPGPPVRAERLLVATGRRPATDGLGAEAAGVALGPDGEVVVDARLATGAEGVFAAGDVTGHAQLTHLADEMGRLAARNAFARRGRALALAAIPSVVFTDPEVARVGVAEADAPGRARVAEVAMSGVDRAATEGREEGFARLVAVPRPLLGRRWGGRLVGATIVCPRAGELIHEPALAIRSGMFAGRLAQTVHAYPTWSTAIRQAAAQLVDAPGAPRARRPRGEPRRAGG